MKEGAKTKRDWREKEVGRKNKKDRHKNIKLEIPLT